MKTPTGRALIIRSFALAVLFPLAVFAQPLISLQLEPQVIVPGQTASVLLQVRETESLSRVTFQSPTGAEVDMKDDGTAGDPLAGDGIYSISLPAGPIVAAMTPSDVYRPFVGFVRPYQNSTALGAGAIFAEVADPQIPRPAVILDAPDVQHTDYIVNIRLPEAFPSDATPSTIPNQALITKRFFQVFPDVFDALNIVYVPSFFRNRFQFSVRNAVQGIGRSIFDSGSAYGSPARLKGISVFPLTVFFDGAEAGMQHELAHQWINHLNVSPLAVDRPHWPLSTMASGIMGFSIRPTFQGGRFPCLILPDSGGLRLVPNPNEAVFNDLDLYLMGLLPPEQVADQIVLDRQDQSVISECNGGLYNGTFTTLRVSDLINNPAIGPRVPSWGVSPKRFRLATIVVTKDALLSADAMAFYNFFAKRMELRNDTPTHVGFLKATAKPFAISTRGLGAIIARIGPPHANIGVFNSGHWQLDVSGNGQLESGVEPNFSFGFPGTAHVLGDWNGDGRAKVGVYVNGFWFLDYDGNHMWDGGVADKQVEWGWAGATPIVGDWNGDGRDTIGVFANGFWFLDADGDGIWDGPGADIQASFGWKGVMPLVGDWNGDGRDKIGIYVNGFWFLDYNGDSVWNGPGTDRQAEWGWNGVYPLVGDWSGDGRETIGVYYNGFWFLDKDGDGVWDGPASDIQAEFGFSGVTPVVGDWSGAGSDKIGVFFNGRWYLDADGNGAWDGGVNDSTYVFGQAGDTPLVGPW